MIDKLDGDLIFVCDTCGETFESETSDFNAAWNHAKRDGWRARKLQPQQFAQHDRFRRNTEWAHECPNCH